MAYDSELANRIRERLAAERGVSEKAMFGGLAFLIAGHLTVSAGGRGGLMLRVDPGRTAALLDDPHATRFRMRGRELDGWLHISDDGTSTDTDLDRWVSEAVRYVRSLPPKSPRAE